jgi:hypothetical protein
VWIGAIEQIAEVLNGAIEDLGDLKQARGLGWEVSRWWGDRTWVALGGNSTSSVGT